jgi:hypothetical protein
MMTASMSLRSRIWAVVAGGKDVVAPEFLAVLEPAVVTIRHGNELHPGNLRRRNLGISLALATGADQRDLNMIVGRYRLGRFGLSLGQQMRFSIRATSPPLPPPLPL